MPFDLTEYPINHPAAEGEAKISWQNDYLRVSQVPSISGDHVLLTNGDGSRFDGAGTLISDGKNILLVKQNRWASGIQTWEIPMGGLDTGETPQEGALREVFEETGVTVTADKLVTLGTIHPLSSRVKGTNHLYLVHTPNTQIIHQENDEIIALAWVPIGDVFEACMSGTLGCESTTVAVLRAKLLGLI